jgi:hypothetical protein
MILACRVAKNELATRRSHVNSFVYRSTHHLRLQFESSVVQLKLP